MRKHTDTDKMEMPCRCDCGEWFDLHDGNRSKKGNKVICDACSDRENEIHVGDSVFSDSLWLSGKVWKASKTGIHVNFGTKEKPIYRVFHFKPTHRKQKPVKDLEKIF